MTDTQTRLPHRILVIDDNTAIHEDFRKILTQSAASDDHLRQMESALFGAPADRPVAAAFEIDCATQGKEGLEMVRRAQAEGRPYALAFVDGRMPPGWDGIETIGHLWRACPRLQVVLCTAYADYSWQEIRRVLGESDSLLILKKPFDNVEVLQLAHALTRKWELAREVQGRLNQLAFYDSLTGLPNRVLFIDRLTQTLHLARRYERTSALLFIDMDNFKRINDTLGHTIGDDLLRTTAERLSQCLRTSDTVARGGGDGMAARLGGDEFTVVLPELAKAADAAAVALRISEQLRRPMQLGGHQVIVTPSIGVAIFPRDGESVEELLKNADLAMYFAKRTGPDTYAFYDKSMNAAALKRVTLEDHLRQAFERDELTLHYQPQIDLRTGRLSGMEALLRWHNWELGDVPPVEFIPVAEECGLIVKIGEWVLRTACAQAVTWTAQGLPLQKMAVNVSVKQFLQSDFLSTVRNALSETGLAPDRLEIEVTESVLAQDPQGMDVALSGLRRMGVRIAVDDFGNGYSSLSRLKRMPVDCLKIDRSFVCGIDGDVTNQSIITAILAMAEGMDLPVIAEGVETDRQADFLRGKQCREVQGYLFSRPLSSDQAEAFLRRDHAAQNGTAQSDVA